MKKLIWKLTTGILLIFFLQACGSKTKEVKETKETKGAGKGGNKPPQPPLKVEGYVVKTSTLNQSIDVPGSLLPFEETEIHPEVAGKVVMLSIREGAYVSRGTLLAKLFDGDLQAQMRKDQVQLQLNQKNEERQRQLLKIGGISQQDYDVNILNVSNVRADMQILQANIAKTVIRAPFSGKMGFKNISIGAYVTPATVVTTIRQVNKLKLEFSIPQKYNSKVAIGQFVSFNVEGSPKKYSGRVMATESSITETDRALKVRAEVDNVDKYITAGSFAKVNFNMGDNNQAIMIPSQAIIPQARDKKVIVYRMGAANFQIVKTGTRDSANVQIVEGLAVGDTIVTTGILQIKPGSKVQFSSIKK
ncbi:MAG: efflux RND transporter periplasmic adaptor subunit [Bacteroidota bacterium]|nr:efflux RND transporter periplasmic adaptor subunit [Bacteroidota bacterium]